MVKYILNQRQRIWLQQFPRTPLGNGMSQWWDNKRSHKTIWRCISCQEIHYQILMYQLVKQKGINPKILFHEGKVFSLFFLTALVLFLCLQYTHALSLIKLPHCITKLHHILFWTDTRGVPPLRNLFFCRGTVIFKFCAIEIISFS